MSPSDTGSGNDDNKKKRNPWGPAEPPRGPWGGNGGGGNSDNNRPGGNNTNQPDFDDLVRRATQSFRNSLPGGSSSGGLIALGIAGILVLWMLSGFYFVQSNENAVILTFGQYTRTDEAPGLKYRLPWPVQSATIVDVTQERRLQIGYEDQVGRSRAVSTAANGDESLMLTGDENIIDINFVVLWRISNAKDFLFSLRDPDDTIKLVASSAMREVIGQTKIQSALTEGRTKVQIDTRALMQKILDEYKSGITVNNVQLQKVDPPEAVVDAFNEVQRARQDQERAKNQAQAYSNSILPVAKGEASKLLQQAEAYKQEVINRANGDAARFNSVYEAYKSGPSVTAERMYLETMEDVLKNAKTVVVGSSNGNNILPYLPIQGTDKPVTKPKATEAVSAPAVVQGLSSVSGE